MMIADSSMVTIRNTIARPDIISGFTGRISLTTNAMMAGATSAHATHRAVARNHRPCHRLQRKGFGGRVIEESGDLEIELGIKAEQQSDHHRQRERNVESGPVHGGGLAEPAEE
jgi:hypothetical protein